MSATPPATLIGNIVDRLETLAAIGGEDGGGVTRLAYSEEERRAHELFAVWASSLGARVESDAAGNTIAVLREGEPYFLRLAPRHGTRGRALHDGAAGVVGALEAGSAVRGACAIWSEGGRLRRRGRRPIRAT